MVAGASPIDLEGSWSLCDCPDMSQWLPLLSETAEFAAEGFAAAMKADADGQSFKALEQWLTKEIPCDPLPFQDLDQRWTITDYRYGRVYMLWDPHIRGDDALGAGPKKASAAVCFPGRILVHLLCSQKAILTADLSDFGYHLQAIQEYSRLANGILSGDHGNQDLLTISGADENDGWLGCAAWTPWQNVLVRRPEMERYVERVLTGRIPWPPRPGNRHLLAFEPPLRYQARVKIHPLWRLCAPLKARQCFPAFGEFDCLSCCDIRQGPRGKESCWSGPYQFEACCQRDFRDEHKRTHCLSTGEC